MWTQTIDVELGFLRCIYRRVELWDFVYGLGVALLGLGAMTLKSIVIKPGT